MVRAPRAPLPAGNPVGLDFDALALFEREFDGEVAVGSGMHDQVICWDDEVPVEYDQVMRDRAAPVGSGKASEEGDGRLGDVRRRDSDGGSGD